MVHQEPTDEVMRISDTFPRNPIGGQQKARVLESTTCQNNSIRLYLGAPAIKGAYLERFDPRSILARVDVRDVGVH
jgi:hypothetical protein